MKLRILSSLLSLPTLISGLFLPGIPGGITTTPPTRPHPHPHPQGAPHWDFDLYNNKRCAGPASKAAGWGSSGCRTDVPPGGARGYALKDLDASCSVSLFRDNACESKHRVGPVGRESMKKCHSIGKKYVRSFEVRCAGGG